MLDPGATAKGPAGDAGAAADSRGEDGETRLDVRLWLRLLACTNIIERQVRRGLRRDFDTTLPRFDMLAQLYRAPDGLSMGELSARMMVTNGNVTGLAERLEQEGLVARRPAAEDRRRQTVALTPAGAQAFQAMTPAHASWIDGMVAGLDNDEKQQLLHLLARLKRSAEAYENGATE